MEGDLQRIMQQLLKKTFQSTPSAWRETNHPRLKKKCIAISIHSLRMEGDRQKKIRHPATMIISIHSLRMEGDRFARKRKSGSKPFQSTPSAWRETCVQVFVAAREKISIHSLRMEGDQQSLRSILERRQFQSTPSAWRETPERR